MSPTDIDLRLAAPTDLRQVETIVDRAYGPYLDRMAERPAPMLDDHASLIERGVVHVAVMGDQVRGVLVAWPEADHLFIDNVAVDPTAQGTGTGTALLDHAERLARAAGRSELRLYTNVTMTENLDYYPRRGFVETQRATDAGYDRVYFSRRL